MARKSKKGLALGLLALGAGAIGWYLYKTGSQFTTAGMPQISGFRHQGIAQLNARRLDSARRWISNVAGKQEDPMIRDTVDYATGMTQSQAMDYARAVQNMTPSLTTERFTSHGLGVGE
jgi:hypothetical protein